MTNPAPPPGSPQEPLGVRLFRPLWVRIIITALVAAWCAWEWLYNKDQLWGMITVGMLGWAIYTFFIVHDKKPGNGSKT